MGVAGKAAAARNGRSASVCLMLVLVFGILAGQSTALWTTCLKHCVLHCLIGFPLAAAFCASRCLVECHPGDYLHHALFEEYHCKIGCHVTHQCSDIPPITIPAQNHSAGDRADKMEGHCHSCFNDCEKKH